MIRAGKLNMVKSIPCKESTFFTVIFENVSGSSFLLEYEMSEKIFFPLIPPLQLS